MMHHNSFLQQFNTEITGVVIRLNVVFAIKSTTAQNKNGTTVQI